MSERLRRLVDCLKHDRKITIMVVLLIFGLLLWGRLLLQSDLPRTATAEPAVELVVPGNPSRDLANGRSDQNAHTSLKKTNLEQAEGKSSFKRSDDPLRLATVRRAAEKLQLQNVMMDDEPAAIINGRMITLGQQIQGFTLLEVAKQHVLLEKDEVIVRLKM